MGRGSRAGGLSSVPRPKLFLLCLIALSLLSLSAISALAAPIVWVQPSMARVGPDSPAGSGTSINLYAAKGEWESFQIIVRAPSGGLTGVNVVAPSLGGPQFTLYREHYVFLTRGSPDWATNVNKPLGGGWYPDGLIPFVNPATGADLTGATLDAAPFSLAAGKNQPVWVDVYVPRTASAGQYQRTFTVTSNQGSAAVNLNLTVWNFELPVSPALHSAFLYWTVGDQLQPKQELLRNRIMPTNSSASHASTLVSEGMGAVNMGFWSGADNTTCTVVNPPPSASTVIARANSYPDELHLYAYTADEVSGCSGLVSTMQQYANALHAGGVDQLITMPPKAGWEGIVDVWAELPKQYVASDVQAALARGDKVWSYNTCQQDDYSPKWLLDYAPINYRIQPGFINQSLGMTGLLYWRVDNWTADAWNDVTRFSASFPGEGVLVYPASQVGLSGVVPSMRLKWLRDGADDYDYVQLLKERGEGSWALDLARSVGPDWRNWTRDPNALESVRRQLGEKIHSLSTPVTHELSVSAGASPTTVASGGDTQLSASASDTLGHGIASWSWSDGGAGGSFSPSAAAQNPRYWAAANASGSDRAVQLTVTATCAGPSPLTDSASVGLTVRSIAHTLSVSASSSATLLESGATVSLAATAADSLGHGVASWSWSDGGAGGSFSPSASVASPSYTASVNTGTSSVGVTLTATATCDGPTPISAQDTVAVTVTPFVPPTPHVLSVGAVVSPASVASGGVASLAVTVEDTHGHAVASWSWSDGGAGGSFSPSASVASPSYTAPANTGEADLDIALTVTATCDGPTPASAQDTVVLSVAPAAHALSVTAVVSPTGVTSGGTASLTATAEDTRGHAVSSWQWNDGGAGGSFSPSPEVQSPSYQAPVRSSGGSLVVALTVSATCAGPNPMTAGDTVELSVLSEEEELSVLVTDPQPATVPSEGLTDLSADATGTVPDEQVFWEWSDGGANGSFSPSANSRTPKYRAPKNRTGHPMGVTLTVTGTAAAPAAMSDSASTSITVEPALHTLVVRAYADPAVVPWKGRTNLSAYAEDSLDHGMASWRWTDGGAGGSFTPSADVPDPTYRVPGNSTAGEEFIVLQVTATCAGEEALSSTAFTTLLVEEKQSVKVRGGKESRSSSAPTDGFHITPWTEVADPIYPTFWDVPKDSWAYEAVEACYQAGLVTGYPDGSYGVNAPVTRGLAAVYLARALAGGDEFVPAGPAEPSFSDVPAEHWAYRYVEYARARGVIGGFADGSFHPGETVTRAQTAAFLARTLATPTEGGGLAGYEPPAVPTFADVPREHWAYTYVEYLAARGLVGGYEEGEYRPDGLCSRGQLAVYLMRAFDLTTS